MSRPRLWIVGSCVSRDTYELALKEHLDLTQYTARQSLISGMNSRVEQPHIPEIDFSHRFHQRMFEGDAHSSLRTDLLSLHSPTVILMDLVDERHGVFEISRGTYLTRTVEIIGTPLDKNLLQNHRLIRFGTPEHFTLWSEALSNMLSIPPVPKLAQVILLDIPWASHDTSGKQTPTSYGTTAETANLLTEPYIEVASRQSGITIVSLPSSEAVADPNHRWGPASFHFAQHTYENAARAILTAIRTNSETTQ